MATKKHETAPGAEPGAEGAVPGATAAGAKPGEQTVTLSDGRTARIRKAKGRHLQEGAAAARDPSNPISLMMGVVAQVTLIDGARIVYEDLLELDMDDVLELIGVISGKKPALSLPSAINS